MQLRLSSVTSTFRGPPSASRLPPVPPHVLGPHLGILSSHFSQRSVLNLRYNIPHKCLKQRHQPVPPSENDTLVKLGLVSSHYHVAEIANGLRYVGLFETFRSS